MAIHFLTKNMGPDDEDCIRPRDGDYIRCNMITCEFAVVAYDGFIRTYCLMSPDLHKLPTNEDYRDQECNAT